MKRTILFIVAVTICLSAAASPARPGKIRLSQPDGSTFEAIIKGDEFRKITKTLSGAHIVQEADGFYCYAGYDSEGRKISTGVRVVEEGRTNPVPADGHIGNFIPSNRKAKMMRSIARSEQMLTAVRTKADDNAERHGIIILAGFADVAFQNTRDDFDALINQVGYSRNGAKGCALEYFNYQFKGKYDFKFDISEIVTLSQNREYYGGNDPDTDFDTRADEMVVEACRLVDDKIDFSIYDNDKDGIVENVFVFFAGRSESEGGGEDCIWPHAFNLSATNKTLTLDGVKINSYACASEMNKNMNDDFSIAAIGTFCHEFSHTLGLFDVYDTDYEGEEGMIAAGCWSYTSLMDAGNYNGMGVCPPNYNAVERWMLGISKAVELTDGEHRLVPIQDSDNIYILNTDTDNEFYFVECRNNEGWDELIGGSGMLIYHVDKSENETGISSTYNIPMSAIQRWLYNEPNASVYHQCCDLIEADGRSDRLYGTSTEDIEGIFFPTDKNNSFSAYSSPAATYWSGEEANFIISDITRVEDDITFKVKTNVKTDPPDVEMVKTEVFQDAAILVWKADQDDFVGDAKVSYGPSNAEKDTCTVKQDNGTYTLIMRGLKPRTAHKAEIYFSVDGINGASKSHGFTTRMFTEGDAPYIYVKGCIRGADGSFPKGEGLPLVLFNAVNAETVKWFYDGKEITYSSTSYFKPEASGELKAVAEYPDGSREILIKHIEVK